MSPYAVEFTTAAARQLRKLDPVIRRRLLAAIGHLGFDPRPQGCKKLVGEDVAWRVRVGEYRVIYEILDERLLITVLRAAHRRDVY